MKNSLLKLIRNIVCIVAVTLLMIVFFPFNWALTNMSVNEVLTDNLEALADMWFNLNN